MVLILCLFIFSIRISFSGFDICPPTFVRHVKAGLTTTLVLIHPSVAHFSVLMKKAVFHVMTQSRCRLKSCADTELTTAQ